MNAAPSSPARFDEFTTRYLAELQGSSALLDRAGIVQQRPTLTLVYDANDEVHNHAIVLR